MLKQFPFELIIWNFCSIWRVKDQNKNYINNILTVFLISSRDFGSLQLILKTDT